MQEFVEQRVPCLETAPGRGQVQHRAMPGAAQNCPAQENLNPQAGRLAITRHTGGPLELCQQVEEHQNAQESRLGRIELLQTKIIRGPVRFQLLDALLDASPLVVVAPNLFRPIGSFRWTISGAS